MEQTETDQVKRICALVQERNNTLLEKDVRIKYYKDAIETSENKIKEIEKARKKLANETKIQKQLVRQVEAIGDSVRQNQEVGLKALLNHEILEKMITKEIISKKLETKQIQENVNSIYEEAQAKLATTCSFQKMNQARVNFLKVDIAVRALDVKIRERKLTNAQHLEIQKKKFYNFFVGLAEDYVLEKNMRELEKLKELELQAIKKLHVLQEKQKMNQKMGVTGDNVLKNMSNIFFGSQEEQVEKPKRPVVTKPPSPKKLPQSISEKLDVFLQDEPTKPVEIPQKMVNVIEDKVLVPPQFEPPKVVMPEKRKAVNLCHKWQKMFKSDSKNRSFNDQSPLSSQNASQRSQGNSQQSQVNPSNSQQSQMNSSSQLNNSEMVQSTRDMMKMTDSFAPTQSEDAPQGLLLRQTIEEQIPMQISMGGECLTENTEFGGNSQSLQSQQAVTFPDQTPVQKSVKSILSPADGKMARPRDKQETGDPIKSVRFNLEPKEPERPKESSNRGMFGQTMFGNPFGGFFGGGSAAGGQFASNEKPTQPANINNSFGMTMADASGANSSIGSGFEPNDTHFGSPNFSYADEEPAFKTPEMPPFGGGGGGGGFFSFGSNSLFPFQ